MADSYLPSMNADVWRVVVSDGGKARMRRLRTMLASVTVAAAATFAAVVLAHPAAAASLVQVTNFGSNPGGMEMYVYVPNTHPANPAIVVAMHGCGGSGPGFY